MLNLPLTEKKETLVQNRFIFEEKAEDGRLSRYIGKDSTNYSGSLKSKQKLPTNDFTSANYALMIFDQKKNAFRLVPINRHLYFEKQKQVIPVQRPVSTAPTVNGGIPARRPNVAPRKKAKDILKNFKSMINKQKS